MWNIGSNLSSHINEPGDFLKYPDVFPAVLSASGILALKDS